jgi:hypothetical protein
MLRLDLRRDSRGVVGVNLVLVIAFALYAVIMLSRTTLAAKQIDDRVRVIVTEVGPGSNVSRLDETQKLNTIGKTAEDILAAARPLSGQAQTILDDQRQRQRDQRRGQEHQQHGGIAVAGGADHPR